MNLLAQAPVPQSLGKIGGTNLGPFGNISFTGTSALQALARGISSIIGLMTIVAGIWFMIQFVIGGFFWISAGGDKTKLETARHRINDAFVGLIIVVSGWAILALAAQFFNIDFLLEKPGNVLQDTQLQPQP